jgi:hypothetical protein
VSFRRKDESAVKAVSMTVLSFLLLPLPCQGEDVTVVFQRGRDDFAGVQDVSIASDGRVKDRNFGGRKFLHLWPEGDAIFIRFDLIDVPRTATVKRASLELFSTSVGFSKEEMARAWPVVAYDVRRGWAEGRGGDEGMPDGQVDGSSGATFLTTDGKNPWPNGDALSVAGVPMGTAVLKGPHGRWPRWELDPRVVQDWVSGERPNFGFILFGRPPGKAISFASSESDEIAQHPVLRLTLSVIPAEARKLRRFSGRPITAARGSELSPEEAVALIERLGGKVIRDEGSPDRPVVQVYLGGSKVTNADLARLKGLTQLRYLNLFETGVTDAGLANLKELRNLEHLVLSFTRVSDAGLLHLSEMTHLKEIAVGDTKVTRAGAKRLQKALPKLKILFI